MKVYEIIKSLKSRLIVIPVKTGIQSFGIIANSLDSRSKDRGIDDFLRALFSSLLPNAYCLLSALLCLLLSTLLLSSCSGLKDAREIKQEPMPPKYVETKEKEPYIGEGSLWANRASLYEDQRARRVNDIVTILITETTAATKQATTNSSRASSVNDTMTNALGLAGYSFPIKNLEAGLAGSGTTSFKGEGDTARKGTVTATIAAKVVEVLPNGNLVLESRKETILNNDKEIIVVRGIIRPEDISSLNTIPSQQVADAKIYIVGEGELDNKQSQGWLLNIMDKVWPF